MKKYEIVLYDYFHTINTEEKFYKYLLKCYIDKYKNHFIKSIRICESFKSFLFKKYIKLKNHKLAELCYWFYYDLNDFPKCDNKKCNNRVIHFRSFHEGYCRGTNIKEHYCCNKCALNSEITKQRKYNTCKKLYGTINPNQFNSFNEKYRKFRQINVYKLFLSEESIPLFSLEYYLQENISNLNKKDLRWKCTKCNREFYTKIKFYNNRINGKIHHARCPYCYPLYSFSGKTTSNREKEVLRYIKEIYHGKIIENDRTLMIPNKKYNNWKLNHELDIVLPEIKIAFEFNGYYWHNPNIFPETIFDDNEKIRQCNNLGIKLIYIREEDWLHNKIITQKKILNEIKMRLKYFIS